MRTYFAYIRVSTAKQGMHGVSLQEQRDAIARYARSRALTVSEWFEEQETAAKRGRPTFTRMLERLKRGEASGVIIHKIDRSARNLRDWADLGELIDAGIEVHFSNESLDLSSRGGRLSADIQAVVAADYVRNLREETRKRLYGRLKQGLYPWPAPLGYLDRGKGQSKALDPQRAPLVRAAFELYATCGYTLKSLRMELHERGLRTRRGGTVSTNGLNRVLRNPFYAGIIKVGTTGQTFKGVHEPLISMRLFERVQAVLDGRLTMRAAKHDFVFRRLLTCVRCGRRLIGELQKGRVYYRCHTSGCRTSVREDHVEACIHQAMARMELSEEEHEALCAALADLEAEASRHQEETTHALRLSLQGLQSRLDRLTDAFLDGVIDQAAYVRKRDALMRDSRVIEEKLAISEGGAPRHWGEVANFLELAKSLRFTYEMALAHEKREFLREATSNRLVSGKNVQITWQKAYQALAERPESSNGDPYRDKPRTRRTILDIFSRIT